MGFPSRRFHRPPTHNGHVTALPTSLAWNILLWKTSAPRAPAQVRGDSAICAARLLGRWCAEAALPNPQCGNRQGYIILVSESNNPFVSTLSPWVKKCCRLHLLLKEIKGMNQCGNMPSFPDILAFDTNSEMHRRKDTEKRSLKVKTFLTFKSI